MNIVYATVESADDYLAKRAFSSNWDSVSSDADKEQYLSLASNLIYQFASYSDSRLDLTNSDSIAEFGLADTLGSACIEEALYLVNLGKDPTQILNVLTLGIATTDGTTFDEDKVADYLSPMSVNILTNAGFEITTNSYRVEGIENNIQEIMAILKNGTAPQSPQQMPQLQQMPVYQQLMFSSPLMPPIIKY